MSIILSFALVLLLLSSSMTFATVIINDCTGLQNIKNDLTGQYVLGKNIDCTTISGTSKGFIPIGGSFSGSFNGLGFSISNLKIKQGSNLNSPVGLFSTLSSTGIIQNVGLKTVQVAGVFIVGALVGDNDYGTIRNIRLVGGTVNGRSMVGGLVGVNDGLISNCTSNFDVNGQWDTIGGLVGSNGYGSIIYSSTSGAVSLSSNNGGGLIGRNFGYDPSGVIEACSAIGDVSSPTGSYIGGFVGRSDSVGSFIISNSYSLGDATGYSYVGGFVGESDGNIMDCYTAGAVIGTGDVTLKLPYRYGAFSGSTPGTIIDSFFDSDLSGSGTTAQGVGLSTAEMKDGVTIPSYGWNTAVWAFPVGKYPQIKANSQSNQQGVSKCSGLPIYPSNSVKPGTCYSGFPAGTSCSTTCAQGYKLTSGSLVAQCSSLGEWSSISGVCTSCASTTSGVKTFTTPAPIKNEGAKVFTSFNFNVTGIYGNSKGNIVISYSITHSYPADLNIGFRYPINGGMSSVKYLCKTAKCATTATTASGSFKISATAFASANGVAELRVYDTVIRTSNPSDGNLDSASLNIATSTC